MLYSMRFKWIVITHLITSNTIQNIYHTADATVNLYGIKLGSTGTYTVSKNTIDKLYNNSFNVLLNNNVYLGISLKLALLRGFKPSQ